MSREQLKSFQASHVDHYGRALAVDGIDGPKTAWARAMTTYPKLRQQIVAKAQTMIGLEEEPMGSNRNHSIDGWLARCGVWVPPPGQPAPQNAWCAAFASWVLSGWGDGMPERTQARVRDLVSDMEEIPLEQVQPGDLGFFLRKNLTGHVWLVIGETNGWTMNIEGNTGHAVRVTQRPRARYLRAVPARQMPEIVPGTRKAGISTR